MVKRKKSEKNISLIIVKLILFNFSNFLCISFAIFELYYVYIGIILAIGLAL